MDAAAYRRAPWAAAFATAGGLILYNGLTGRTLTARGVTADTWRALGEAPIAADALPPGAGPLIERGLLIPADATARALAGPRFPLLGRWTSFLHAPGAPPVIATHVAGGRDGWTTRRLDPLESWLWLNCRGEVTVDELLIGARAVAGPTGDDQAFEILQRWTSADAQWVKLLDAPVHAGPLPPHAFGLVHSLPRAPAGPGAQPPAPAGPPLRTLLAAPSAALGGRPFAAALVDALTARRALPAGGDVAVPPDLAAPLAAQRPDLRLCTDPPSRWPARRFDVIVLDDAGELTPAQLSAAHGALAPGGGAWGLVDGDPRGALVTAEAAGYAEADVAPAAAWLGIEAVPVLAGPADQLAALRALLAAHGHTLPPQAWTKPELTAHLGDLDLAWLHHPSFAPATTRIMSRDTHALWSLWLRA